MSGAAAGGRGWGRSRGGGDVGGTRRGETEGSGRRSQELWAGAGHVGRHYRIVPDEPAVMEPLLLGLLTVC